jgi:uncharacterized protein YndB with AHSA1/START domain
LKCNLTVAGFRPWYYAQPMSCITREIVLPVPRERAWELVTDEDELREWLADDVEFEAEEGAPVRADDREGVVELVEPGERVVFSWGDSRVQWQLEDHEHGTRFVVIEERRDLVWGPTLSAGHSAWGPKLSALASAAMLCPA